MIAQCLEVKPEMFSKTLEKDTDSFSQNWSGRFSLNNQRQTDYWSAGRHYTKRKWKWHILTVNMLRAANYYMWHRINNKTKEEPDS